MKFKISVISILSFAFVACISYNKESLDNLNNEVRVIAHAGSGFASWIPFNPYPANSLTSIVKSLEEGATGVEVDVHMTADKQFILYHDKKLDSKSAAVGCLSDMDLEELQKVDYKLGFPFDWFQEEKLISLNTLLDELSARGSKHELHLDLRIHSECHDTNWDKMWEGVLLTHLDDLLSKSAYPKDKIYLITYSRAMILHARELNLPYHLNFEIIDATEEDIPWLLENSVQSVTIKPALLTPEISKELHQKGIEVITFGARSKSGNKKLLELNPDVIQTNNVNALRELLD